MLFNSYIFWGFFAIVLLVYWRLPHKLQNRFLLVASYVFYGAWDWRFLSLIAASTIVDYFCAGGMVRTDSSRRRKRLLFVSLFANLGLLGVFKYYGFFVDEFNSLMGAAGLSVGLPVIGFILPVGISFYTFQTLSYTIDVYRRDVEPAESFLDFALYVSFFPQLVAGPIERSSSLLPQLLKPRRATTTRFIEGLHLIVLGLFKKVVLADNMAPIANAVFDRDLSTLSGAECLVGVYAFAFQIYGDFSGYSSIAKGVAKWMGFDLRANFAMPYIAQSPQEFWRRWHISLSTWLRDYLYIPLGGGRGSRLMTYRNLSLTMILGGLWHGAAWTFIAWGVYQGALLAIHRFFREFIRPAPASVSSFRRVINIFVMFQFTCIGWLIFRADSMAQVGAMLRAMFTNFESTSFAVSAIAMVTFFALPLFLYEAWIHTRYDSAEDTVAGPTLLHAAALTYCTLMFIFFPPPVANEFIYFRF